jgi:hypothetical protein
MDSALFGLTMLAVGWLIVWVTVDRSKMPNAWWPFTMKAMKSEEDTSNQANSSQSQIIRQPVPKRPWKRSGF